MAYHTRLALDSGRPVPMQIGGRSVVARPVSVPVMLAVLSASASGDIARMVQAEILLLRAAFPRPRFAWRDPVRAALALPHDLRRAIIHRLARIPADPPPDESDDPLAATRAWQRAAVRPAVPTGPRPTLLLAAQACRAAYGESWYFDPARWQTTDGYVPHDVCWIEYAGLAALEARAQLLHVHAHAVAHSGKGVRRAVDALLREAFPLDPLTRGMVS